MSRQTAIWLDGIRTTLLPLPDRGVDFGDGVFETLLVRDGKPLFVEYHLDRLAMGLEVLEMPDCLASVQSQLNSVVRATEGSGKWAALRLNVLRGPGPRGYSPLQAATPRILIYVSNLERNCAKINHRAALCIANVRLSMQAQFARIKHLNRLDQIMAAIQAQDEGVDEGVMLDQAGNITSVIAGNIFMVHNTELLTPPLIDCGVAGTRRRLIMEKWAPAIGLRVKESRFSISDLSHASEVFYSNSLETVRPIARIADHDWENHDVCEALFQRFLEDLE